MRLLVLNVDRDDDLGRKTGIRGPILGRQEMIEAATALSLADPEEADANGMFAAVKEYDEILPRKFEFDADEVFVGAVTGHMREGLMADNAIAQQVDELLRQTRADAVILVSDGGEDEHVVPILKTRVKVNGTKRVIVKQAKNLEGAFYLFSRLINDEKLQRRFFMPLALLLIAAGAAILEHKPELFLASALFLAALYIFIQVFNLSEPIGNAMHRLGENLRAGKLAFFFSLVALGLLVWGGFRTLRSIGPVSDEASYTLAFADSIYWYFAGAVLLVIFGRGADHWVRAHAIRPRHWDAFTFFLAAAIAGFAVLEFIEGRRDGKSLDRLFSLRLFTFINFAGFLVFCGLIGHRYFARLAAGRAAQPQSVEE